MTKSEKIDVLVGFDTTGSMYPVIGQVRRVVSEMIANLFSDIPGIRIGIMAIGDYCDEGNPYVIEEHDLSQNKASLVKFVQNVKPTHGGDSDECYEFALHKARSMSWEAERKRVFVLIGDANPHEPNYPLNKKRLDWRNESKMLSEMGVSIYSVHALAGYRSESRRFYQQIAEKTNGHYFTLDQFDNIVDILKGICNKQAGEDELEAWKLEIDLKGKKNRDIENAYAVLSGKNIKSVSISVVSDDLIAAGRFQTLMVDRECRITDFVKENGLLFRAGRCFYEFTKPEILRAGREVILFNKETGEATPNIAAREKLGVGGISGEIRIRPGMVPVGFDCFIQSTSYTRKLVAGTRLLYEVDLER